MLFVGCFQKVNFQKRISIVIRNFQLSSGFLCGLFESFHRQAVLYGNNCVSVKIRDNLLCITNHCMEVSKVYDNSKLTLSSSSAQSKTNLYLMQVNDSQSPNDLSPIENAQTHCHNVRTILYNLFQISSHLPKKLVVTLCLSKKMAACKYLMHSTVWVN